MDFWIQFHVETKYGSYDDIWNMISRSNVHDMNRSAHSKHTGIGDMLYNDHIVAPAPSLP